MSRKPLLWVKSYPYPPEVSALTDLGAQDVGMEIFLGSNVDKNEECLRICRDSYPRFGVELFCYQDEEKGRSDIVYDPCSLNDDIRRLSRSYLFSILELAVKYGASHLQLDGNDGYVSSVDSFNQRNTLPTIQQKKDLLLEIRARFGDIPIYFENTIPIDDHAVNFSFSLTGHRLSDFWREGLPLEYDIAHHAIALDVYSRASEFGFPLTFEEEELGRQVRKSGITAVFLDELQRFPSIYFTHLGNAMRFSLGVKSDVIPDNPDEALLDLDRVLPLLMEKSLNITPEVQDKNYVKRPNLRSWIARLQEYSTSSR